MTIRSVQHSCGQTLGLILGLASSSTCIIWDGGFCPAEYRITFRDSGGNAVPGVELRVENGQGSEFFHYPVTDYLPDQIPTSGDDGVLVFHHACYSGLEFSGRCWYLFFVIPMGEQRGPVYVCRFLYRGQEVYRIRYDDLSAGDWNGNRSVKRRWKWPDWPYQFLESHHSVSGDWESVRLHAFDRNGNGRLERDEAVAGDAAVRAHGKTLEARQLGHADEEELDFHLVEKTVKLAIRKP
jgi:hypothetical protein